MTHRYRVHSNDKQFFTLSHSAFNLIAVLLLVAASLQAQGTVTDYDGNVYQTVTIGTQVWMAENLKVTHYRNGDSIPNVTDNGTWGGLSTGAYCNYNNDVNNVAIYGRLYNWYAVDTSLNIAPSGWHVPTDAEWKQLEMYLGMSQAGADMLGWRGTVEGGKMKETGTTHWNSPNTGATNESGFSALPGGFRSRIGSYVLMGAYVYFWSSTESTEDDSSYAWYRELYYDFSAVYRGYNYMHSGFSVRCVRDDPATGVDDQGSLDQLPYRFELAQNYPNPFNPLTTIEYSLPSRTDVAIEIFNVLGQKVRTLVNEAKSAGSYRIEWSGSDDAGRPVSTGVYLYHFRAGDVVQTKKMLLIK